MKIVVQTAVMGTVGLLVGATASAGLPANVIYRNDFTTRESAAAIPRVGETYEATPYPTTNAKIYQYLDTTAIKNASVANRALNGFYGYDNFLASYWSNVGDSRPSYDGWFQPYFSKGTAGSYDLLFLHTGTVYQEVDADGNVNPCFRFYYSPNSEATRTGTALKSLHNIFTNGQLRIQVDLKMPLWLTQQAHFWMFPVFDKYMDIEAWEGTSQLANCAPGLFGVRSGGDVTRPYPLYYDSRKKVDGTTQLSNTYNVDAKNNINDRVPWIRYVVTYDLDTGKFSGRWDALTPWVSTMVLSNATEYAALPHPTFTNEVLTIKSSSFSNASWINSPAVTDLPALWAEKGGISGIGFFLGKTGKASNDGCNIVGTIGGISNNKVQADNIRVSWKAPGAEDFVVCYEDDFSNRTYRVVSAPDVGTTATYATGTEETGPVYDAFTGYAASNSSTKNDGYNKLDFLGTAKSPYGTTLQSVGVDDWRRLIPYTSGMNGRPWINSAYDGGAGGHVMEIGADASFACIAQTLMTNIVSGKVRIVADAHLPNIKVDMFVLDNTRDRMAIGLGTPALYSSVTAGIDPNTLASAGIYREVVNGTEIDEETGEQTAVKLTNDVVFVRDAENTVRDVALAEGVEIERHKWYRLELVADVEARTYDMSITPLGALSVGPDFVPTNDVLYAESGIPFYGSNTGGIGTFYLWGFGYGGTPSSSKAFRTCFDNVQVWNIVTNGETTATNLVYSNIFSKRVRMLANTTRASGRLSYQYDRDDGQDHWIRQNGSGAGMFEADATVRDDNGNQFLSLGRESGDGHQTRYTTSLGQSVDRGVVTITADVRPPEYWFGRTGGSVILSLGNKLMEQNQVKNFAAGHLLRFGFRDSTSTGNGGRYSDIRPFVLCSPDGMAVGTGTGSYEYLGGAVSGSAKKWYRFIIKANMDKSTFDAAVYDMGTAHPEPGSAHGAQIGSVTGLSLMNPPDDGLSSLDVACYGVTSTFGETGVDPLHALIDNISVKIPPGFSIFIR